MKYKFGRFSGYIIRILKSEWFFALIIALAVAQGLWFVLSLKPALFDELRHIQFIQYYAHNAGPFIESQSPSMDYLGQVSREPSYAYYYLMSLVLRIILLFTDNFALQVIFLRLLNIGIFVGALFLLRAVFKGIGISPGVRNMSMFAFISLPAVGSMLGAITYDIGVLPLIFLTVLITIKIIKKKMISLPLLFALYTVVCLAAIVKYTSIPISIVCSIAIALHLINIYRTKPIKAKEHFNNQIRSTNPGYIILGLLSILFLSALLIERPLQNVVVYKNIAPDCFDVIKGNDAVERCSKNYVYKRNIDFLAIKSREFVPVSPVEYIYTTWVPGMIKSTLQQYPNKPPLLVMNLVIPVMLIAGAFLIMLSLRELISRNPTVLILVVIIIFYAASVFYSNYKGYAYLGQPVAISARYMLPVIPLFFALMFASSSMLLHGFVRDKVIITLSFGYIALMSQGGGAITHMLSVDRYDYWDNNFVVQLNESLKTSLQKVTKN